MVSAFNLHGRTNREDYWRGGGAMQLAAGFGGVAIVIGVLIGGVAIGLEPGIALVLAGILFLGVVVLSTAASFALSVRRMHDLGASGWWVGFSYASSFAGTCLMFAGILSHAKLAIPFGLAAWVSATPIGFRLNWSHGQRGRNRFGEPPPLATTRPSPVPEWTRPRDLDAELRAARADFDRDRQTLK